MNKRLLSLAGALLPTAALLGACETTPCIPTKTEARDAAVADVARPLESAVLEAKLTGDGKPLDSKVIVFRVDDSGKVIGEGTTNDAGIARLDLKRKPTKLVDPVRGGAYRASFANDGTYCSSNDAAEFKLARVK